METDLFDNFPLWSLFLIIGAGGIAVWIAGGKISHYAGIISERTGLGHAFIGAVLLGGVTSLPELATTVSASVIGSAPIAVNNIIGGVSMQIAVLAIADLFARKIALSQKINNKKVHIQALLNILLLAVLLTGTMFSGIFSGQPFWTALIFILYIGSLLLIKKAGTVPDAAQKTVNAEFSNKELVIYTLLASVMILIAGFVISVSGETIATKTIFGESFIGAVLIAATTSLPELSTTIAAVKEKKFSLAASNIFGSNLIILSFLFLADLAYSGESVLTQTEDFSKFGALLGIILASIYLIGFNSSQKRTYLNLGIDSVFILICYSIGLIVLFILR